MSHLFYNKTSLLVSFDEVGDPTLYVVSYCLIWGCCGRDHMVVGITTTYAISAYHH
jgi:hypothetical protein